MLLAALCAIAASLLYVLYKRKLNYFKRLNVPYLTPNGILGNFKHIFKETPYEIARDFYLEMKAKGCKYAGFYASIFPIYMPIDEEHIKNILIKNFSSFDSRAASGDEKYDPTSVNLFTANGERWKRYRIKVTPSFTTAKMKNTFESTLICAKPFEAEIARLSKEAQPIDIYDLMVNFTIDIIGHNFFGLDFNSFENPNVDYKRHIVDFFQTTPFEVIKNSLALKFPTLFMKILGMRLVKQDCVDYFRDTVNNIIEYRKTNAVRRSDFMQTLIDSMDGDKLININDAVSLTLMMFLAGHETTSLALAHCIFELAKREDIQDKIRNEIKQIGEVTFESLSEMKYIENVINEALRMYPSVPTITRVTSQNYKIPGSETIIEKDTLVVVPLFGIQRDPDFFADPNTFNPDRFSNSSVPHGFMPFGGGPRKCPAMKMVMMDMKVTLVTLFKNYKIKLDSSTPTEMKFHSMNITLKSTFKIMINAERVN